MSTLRLLIVNANVSYSDLDRLLSKTYGYFTMVVTDTITEAVAQSCRTHCCTYVPLRHLFLGIVCSYLLPFQYVEITHISESTHDFDESVCSDVAKRMCDDGYVVCSRGFDVDIRASVYAEIQRTASAEHVFCDRVADRSNTVLVRRDWLPAVLQGFKHNACATLLDQVCTLIDRRLIARSVGDRGRAASKDLCICIFAYNRPRYCEQLIKSLQPQVFREHVVIFLDSAKEGSEDQRLVEQNISIARKSIPDVKICRAHRNLCVAQNQWWGLNTVFVTAAYERALILEDDVVLGNRVLRTVRNMFPLLDLMKRTIAFNLGYRNYDDKLTLRVVDPYPSELDIKDGCRHVHDHLHYWAWATTRSKFLLMQTDYDKLFNEYFKNVQYSKRNVHAIINAIRQRGVYTQHGSQDWMRHSCFKMNSMHYHIVPSRRLVVPIGVDGFHCNKKIFTERLNLSSALDDVYREEIKVTTPLHHVDSIGVHPSLITPHAWLRRLGYTRWRFLQDVPILFVPESASCDESNTFVIRENDNETSQPWIRYVNNCVRESRNKDSV